jgi:hypothetical protein
MIHRTPLFIEKEALLRSCEGCEIQGVRRLNGQDEPMGRGGSAVVHR